jgi:putative FmdB family regulatory protein
MPIYEYHCKSCGHTFQLLQRMGADAKDVTCPACSSHLVDRLLSCFASTTSGSAVSQASCSAPAT